MTRHAAGGRSPGTDELVRRLAREAGHAASRGPPRNLVFAGFVAAALGASVLVVLAMIGARADLPAIAGSWILLFKVTGMLLLAVGGLRLVRAAMTPGTEPHPISALAPAAVFLALSAVLDRSGVPPAGARPLLSALLCLGGITLAALPALGLTLLAMRRGIPTRLGRAGLYAGLLAGAIGALAYTLACVNDGAAFVALWYPLAVLTVAGIGAALGPRALAW
ncbi:DUF1109 domain-containing protein [Roseomonas sp. HJA6]|uniref:DUF1109 domain-containing protein n=1 Tax=Roseomonas alba TaxID=2846776 RepID=A0ABS7A4G4_9PROT|nr:DUF1109 domain-containing protein [Neoroseomonas alba]MBW6397194.1 DUF1109 domain-containing protein [Neoroseomonas alba]